MRNTIRRIRFSPLYVMVALLALALASVFLLPVSQGVTVVTQAPVVQSTGTQDQPRVPLVQPERTICPADAIVEYLSHYPVDPKMAAEGYAYKESKYAAGPSALPYNHDGTPASILTQYARNELAYRICVDQALLRMVSSDYNIENDIIYLNDPGGVNTPLSLEAWRMQIVWYLNQIDSGEMTVVEMSSPVGAWTTMMVDDAFGVPQIKIVQITEARPSHYLKLILFSGRVQYLRLECGYQPLYWNYEDIPTSLRP